MITVKELKSLIENLPDDMQIVLQRDSEGNGYEYLAGVDADGVNVSCDEGYLEIYDANWTATEADMNDEEWADYLNGPRTLILFP